jgi:hypothetical protein
VATVAYVARIADRVERWPGVGPAAGAGRATFAYGGRPFGHLHRSGRVDVTLPPAVRDQVLTDGMADPGPDGPEWATCRVATRADVRVATRLLRLAYLCRRLEAGERTAAEVHRELARFGSGPELEWVVDATFSRQPRN